MIVNYQKEQTVTKLKKAYSTLSQTTNRAIADNGPIETWNVEVTSDSSGAENFFNIYMKKYLNISKYCGNQTTRDCKFAYKSLNSTSVKTLSKKILRFYLNDGCFIALETAIYGGSENEPKIVVYIDINGQKKPNIMGRDVFYYNYYLRESNHKVIGKFVPYKYSTTLNNIYNPTYVGACTKNSSAYAAGIACAAAIMKSGWKISDDYPW